MRHKGFIFMELLIALMLMASLALFMFPLFREFLSGERLVMERSQAVEQGVWATDLMIEHIKNNRARTKEAKEGDRYVYYRSNQIRGRLRYEFRLIGKSLHVQLYNGVIQPITGGSEKEGNVKVFPPADGRVFRVKRHGLVEIFYKFGKENGEQLYEIRTAVVPYEDLYQGKRYASS